MEGIYYDIVGTTHISCTKCDGRPIWGKPEVQGHLQVVHHLTENQAVEVLSKWDETDSLEDAMRNISGISPNTLFHARVLSQIAEALLTVINTRHVLDSWRYASDLPGAGKFYVEAHAWATQIFKEEDEYIQYAL